MELVEIKRSELMKNKGQFCRTKQPLLLELEDNEWREYRVAVVVRFENWDDETWVYRFEYYDGERDCLNEYYIKHYYLIKG